MLFQYCHGLATQLAHRMHRPMAQPLHDLGFAVLPVRMLRLVWTSYDIQISRYRVTTLYQILTLRACVEHAKLSAKIA